MKRLTLILALIASFTAAFAQKHITDSLMINGQMRTYTMFLPEGIQKDAPLVVFMHGYSKKKVKNFDRFGLDPVAAREKFAVCYIHGLPDSTNHYGYYVGYPPQASMQKHETSDICKITETVQERYQLSKVNAFATGMSNGGDMCYLMAYEGQNTFRALAPVAGITLNWIYQKYEAPHPISIYEIHGTADKTSSWYGDMENKGGWGAYIPVPVAVGRIITVNGCTEEYVTELPRREGRNQVTLYQFKAGKPAVKGGRPTEVWLYKVEGGNHSWSDKDMDTCSEIWRFFSQWID